ncbi:MAG: non-homologous end joining protein Ku [Actinomycetota bacterium]
MPTAVWTGTLSFGLVNVPVRLVSATEPKDVRFHLYDRSGRRVRYERVVEGPPEPVEASADEPVRAEPEAGTARRPTIAAPEPTATQEPTSAPEPVAWEDLLRGQENEFGEVVMLSREEIEQVRPQRSQTIDVEDFVDLADIDPVHFEKTYYAVPRSPEAAKPYVLLHRAMLEAGRVGIGRFVLRTKPHLVAVRPMRDVLAVETLFFGDEVREPAALIPSLGGVQVDERELELAITLIETLRTEWNPAAYADTYREDLLRILAEKSPAAPPQTEPAAARTGPSAVEELMAALKESVEAAKDKQRKRTGRKKAG